VGRRFWGLRIKKRVGGERFKTTAKISKEKYAEKLRHWSSRLRQKFEKGERMRTKAEKKKNVATALPSLAGGGKKQGGRNLMISWKRKLQRKEVPVEKKRGSGDQRIRQ